MSARTSACRAVTRCQPLTDFVPSLSSSAPSSSGTLTGCRCSPRCCSCHSECGVNDVTSACRAHTGGGRANLVRQQTRFGSKHLPFTLKLLTKKSATRRRWEIAPDDTARGECPLMPSAMTSGEFPAPIMDTKHGILKKKSSSAVLNIFCASSCACRYVCLRC